MRSGVSEHETHLRRTNPVAPTITKERLNASLLLCIESKGFEGRISEPSGGRFARPGFFAAGDLRSGVSEQVSRCAKKISRRPDHNYREAKCLSFVMY